MKITRITNLRIITYKRSWQRVGFPTNFGPCTGFTEMDRGDRAPASTSNPSSLSRFFELFSVPLPSFHLLPPHPAHLLLLFSPSHPPLLYTRRCHSHFAHSSSDSIYFFRHYSFSDFYPAVCRVRFALPGHVVENVAKE